MYCINCGVKLSDTETVCPLCRTVVYHPELERTPAAPFYPKGRLPAMPGRSLLLPALLTALWVLAGLIVVLCDQPFTGKITWSGFVLGGLAVSLVAFVLPLWFRRRNPAIFLPCSFATAVVYLWYICYVTGGSWFFPFAFPVCGGVGLIVTATFTLLYYLRRGRLFIVGGAFLAMGGFMLLTECLLNATFSGKLFTGWSLYPLTVLALIGGLLIFLGICRPAREMMARKFFI